MFLRSLPLLLFVLLLLASGAEAKTLTLSMAAYGEAGKLAPYKAQVKQPSGWKVANWFSDRSGVTIYRKVGRRCNVVMSINGSDTRDSSNTSPDAQSFVTKYLNLVTPVASLGSGALNNGSGLAGGLAFSPNGAWGAVQAKTTSGKTVYSGAAGYSASERTNNSYFRQAGVHIDMSGNSFDRCTNGQVKKQKSDVAKVLASTKLR